MSSGPGISWYSVNITLNPTNEAILSGYFSVNTNTNLITGFYETIGGTTDFNTNILETSGTPSKFTYLGVRVYTNNVYFFDNLFMQGWKEFTFYGITLNSMSYFGSSGLKYYISADKLGDETINTVSTLVACSVDGFVAGSDQIININISPISSPLSNTCFPAKTPIQTDQGYIAIERIIPGLHTIRNKKIVGITKTINSDKHLVCFEKDSIKHNLPSKTTIISRNHALLHNGKMLKAKQFVGNFDNIYNIKYRGDILYNVLMEEHDRMVVNNLICETLDPTNDIGKLHLLLEKLNPEQQEKLVSEINKLIVKNDIYKSEYKSKKHIH